MSNPEATTIRRRPSKLAYDKRYHENRASIMKKVKNMELHPDDKQVVEKGFVSEEQAKALRYRREQQFPNDIKGPAGAGKLSNLIVFSYAPPSLTTVPLTILISVYVIMFYENIGASLGYLAFFQALARAFDVVTDPTMSYATDSLRSVHGRRRPFLFTGAPFYALSLFFLLSPWPGMSETAVSTWFGIFYIFFFLCTTYCNIPYDALGPELSDNQDDRSKIFFYCALFDGVGGLAVAILPVGFGSAFSWYRSENEEIYRSCNNPVDGAINPLSAVGMWMFGTSAPPSSLEDWSMPMTQSVADYGWTLDFCSAEEATVQELGDVVFSDWTAWCQCSQNALLIHNLDSTRYAYSAVGFFFAAWAWISLWWCVKNVKERSQILMERAAKEEGGELGEQPALSPPQPMIPSILNTMNNKPFVLLLPAWTLDALASALLGSLVTYFVKYIVQPEFSNQEEYGCLPVGGDERWECSSDMVLGASFLAVLFGAMAMMPVWLWLSDKFGKRNMWLAWSLTNGMTFLCYAFVGKGDVYLCVIMSFFNGAPAGARFLADAIMADVIDYDEYLTGKRAEATYTMFKGFLPKIAAIPASALPIALLASVGHVKVQAGQIQEQPQSVRNFIMFNIVWLPSFLSFIGFLLKLQFPLKGNPQTDLIAKGVAGHLLGKKTKDACTGYRYLPVSFTEQEQVHVDLLNNFPGAQITRELKADPDMAKKKVYRQTQIQLIASLLWIIFFTGLSVATFDKLQGDSSYIPVLSIVAFGTGFTLVGFCYLRFRAASQISDMQVNIPFIKKLHYHRKRMAKLQKFDTAFSKWRDLSIPEERDFSSDTSDSSGGDVAELELQSL